MSAAFSSGLSGLRASIREEGAGGPEEDAARDEPPLPAPRRREPTFDELVSGVYAEDPSSPPATSSVPILLPEGPSPADEDDDGSDDGYAVAPFGDRRPVRADSLLADDGPDLLPARARMHPLAVVGGALLILVLGLLLCAGIWLGLTFSTAGVASPPEWAPDWLRDIAWPYSREGG